MESKYNLQKLAVIPLLAYLLLYALFSASFLTEFPFVHSDEAWLAGLTRDMQAGNSFGVTESFFDLKPRVPHAIKLLFHALQMGYIRLFGYSIQSVRLLSLTAGMICLILLYRIGRNLGGRWTGAALMAAVSLDVSFIYASHFARQEIILCISLLSCILILIQSRGCPSLRQTLGLAAITGLSVGIHPNSFLCAAVCGSVMAVCGWDRAVCRPVDPSNAPANPSNAPADPSLRSPHRAPTAPDDSPSTCLPTATQDDSSPLCSSIRSIRPIRLIRPIRSTRSIRSIRSIRRLLLYTAVTGAIASIFVGISFLFDPHFIPNYFRYGEQEFELSATASSRISQFLDYFRTIYAQESGTYYIPDLRPELILLPVLLLLLLLAWMFLRSSAEEEARLWCRRTLVLLSAVAGLAAGMVVIGRYNQTSIIFFLLLGWVCLFQLLRLFEVPGRALAVGMTLIFLIWNCHAQVGPWRNVPSYHSYLEQLSRLVPPDARTIANLNTGFYFDQGMLLDYRNLPYLENEHQLEQYITKNKIQYICLTDELDYIEENRPYYNVIYGNADFISMIKSYCRRSAVLAGSFENPMYGPRIISLTGNPEYGTVTVYLVQCDIDN